jgi:hypothetical protein
VLNIKRISPPEWMHVVARGTKNTEAELQYPNAKPRGSLLYVDGLPWIQRDGRQLMKEEIIELLAAIAALPSNHRGYTLRHQWYVPSATIEFLKKKIWN